MTYAQRVPSSRDRFRRERESKQGVGRRAMVTRLHHKVEMSLDHVRVRPSDAEPARRMRCAGAFGAPPGVQLYGDGAAWRRPGDQRWRLAGTYFTSIWTVAAMIMSSAASRKASRALAPRAQRTIQRQSDATME